MRALLSIVLLCVALLRGADSVLTPGMRAAIVQLHNQLRGTVTPAAANMGRMVWNPTLEMIAQEHTENCQWEPNDMRHAEAEHLFPTGVGESMALSYGRSAVINQNPEQFIQEWFDERRFYNITYNSCEPGRLCDHFTQLVNAGTVAVGCGFHICQEFEFYGTMLPLAAFFICNYGPQAEPGTRPYMVGPRCSYCPPDHQLCIDGVCTFGYAPPQTTPTTAAPTTPAPTTAAPTTQAPTTAAPTTAAPTYATEPATNAPVTDSLFSGGPAGVTEPLAGGIGASEVFNATEVAPTTVAMPANPMNCTNPTTTLEREMCWLQAWTDWRTKFDVWAHTNCPGP